MKQLNKIIISFFLCLLLISNSILLTTPQTTIVKSTQDSLTASSNTKRTLKNLVVFIEFNDSDANVTHHLDDNQSVANAYKIFNSNELFDMNTVNGIVKVPSFKKYYERESYGDLSITSEIFPKENGKVVSYKDSHPIGYYLKNSANNSIGYTTKEEALKRETELINNATAYISNMVSAFGITANELDTDANGIVDTITFIIEGQENLPSSIAWNDLLWSHKSDNQNIASTILGKKVSAYTLLYAEDYTKIAGLFSLNQGTYGTMIHEFGHSLGYKDLYRYNSNSKPVGFYDIMGSAIGSNPQGFLTYYISEYRPETAWHNPLPVVDKTTNNITLYKPNFIDKNEKRAIKIKGNGSQEEFFIIEYHDKMNTYESHSADQSGIIIYRVNERNKYSGNAGGGNQGMNDHVYIFRPNETALGDGKGELRQATLNMNRRTFGNNDTSNSAFDNKSIYYADGSNSGIKVEVTGQTNNSVTFNVIFPKMDGSGTKEDPYLISDVNSFLYHMSVNTKNKYYKLTADLDFKDINNYPKINFDGYLDGNNKTIRNIKTNGSGIFNNINTNNFQTQTTIENLNFENITVYSTRGDYLGGLSSTATNVTLKNIHLISGTVTNDGTLMHDLASTGGFIGNVNNSVIIENCYSSLDVTAPKNVGGFIGINMNAKIKDSFSSGKVTGNLKTGGFIGLQAITDNTYNTPVNVYYNASDKLSAVGGYASAFHNLGTLNEASLAKGIRGVSVPNELSILKNNDINFSVTVSPSASLTYTVTAEKGNIIKYENNKIRGLNPGTTKVYTDITIGNNKMRLITNVTVKNNGGLVTEKDVLDYLGLTKKDNYVTGFALGTKVNQIKEQISSYSGVTLKSFTDAKGNEINSGLVSTGMKITLFFNNTEYNYTVVIKGDVNGDGLIYATDYVKVKNHIMGKTTLTGAYLKAADVNNDGKIYATDYVVIKNHIMGKTTITQKSK